MAMDGELRYRIRFTRGKLAGQLFALGAEAETVGRSHTCGIRVMEPDVSGRHVMLSVGAKGVELEVISSRRTLLDGAALRGGDRVTLRAGQEVAMGGAVAFELECYRSDGDATEMPESGGLTRFPATSGGMGDGETGNLTSATRSMSGPDGGEEDTRVPSPGTRNASPGGTTAPPQTNGTTAPPTATRITSRSSGGNATSRSSGGDATARFSGGDATMGVTAMPSADETQVLQTRAATPQELAYMRDLHSRKQRRRLAFRLVLGALLAALAGGVYAWLALHAPAQYLTEPPGRGIPWRTPLLDGKLQPVPDGVYPKECLYLECPVPPVFGNGTATARFGLWPDSEVPIQLRLEWYRDRDSLRQDRAASYDSWMAREEGRGSVAGVAIDTTGSEPDDFIGPAPGIPCLRRHYKRKATEAEEAAGVDEWEGVLSFFRLCDTCFVYSREVPAGEALRAEGVLKTTACFLGATSDLTDTAWSGMKASLLNDGGLADLQNAARGLLKSGNTDRWTETERYLTSILVQTYGDKGKQAEYETAMAGLKELRDQQAQCWKRLWTQRQANSSPSSREQAEKGRQADDEVRKLFRSPEDRRSEVVKKTRWWEQ